MSDRLTSEREAEIRAWLGRLGEKINPDWHGPYSAMQDVLAELAAVRAERDQARAALRDAATQVAELESELAGAVIVSEALNRRLSQEQLAGSALYAALTMPTTPEQRQAALNKFTAVAQQVAGGAR